MNSSVSVENDSEVWDPYRNYDDEARLEYGRMMWRLPEMRDRLLAHWLDDRHPWKERFTERRKLVEEVLASELTPGQLNRSLLERGASLRCVAREIPPVFGDFFADSRNEH
jgi:hypothetical protein